MTISSPLAPNSNPRNTYPILTMSSNDTPITPGGNSAGYVSGTLSSMPVSTTVNVVFDLGPDWSMYTSLCLGFDPNWTAGTIMIYGACNSTWTTYSNARRLVPTNTSGTFSVSVTAESFYAFHVRPTQRYVFINATSNGTGTTGSGGVVQLTAYPS